MFDAESSVCKAKKFRAWVAPSEIRAICVASADFRKGEDIGASGNNGQTLFLFSLIGSYSHQLSKLTAAMGEELSGMVREIYDKKVVSLSCSQNVRQY
jgi:hypothetical protein